jgi:hypothetical protein
MKTQRVISTTASLLAVAASLSTPAPAPANSLLSGYGGPGQGSQAILGSALVNGPSGGGGGTSGSGGSSLASPAQSGALSSASAGGSTAVRGSVHGSTRGSARKRHAHASAAAAPAYAHPTVRTGAQVAVDGGTPALGLSGADVLYILLGLAALTVTALLTRQLSRRPG